MKTSKVQREVLQHMARGHKLYIDKVQGRPWLNQVRGSDGTYERVHSSTLYALLRRGLIKYMSTEITPYWRRDYVITDAGREALTA